MLIETQQVRMNQQGKKLNQYHNQVDRVAVEYLHRTTKTVHPTQRLRILSDTPVTSSTDDDEVDISDAPTELYDPDSLENEDVKPKGTFQITTKTLKKQKRYPFNNVTLFVIAQKN